MTIPKREEESQGAHGKWTLSQLLKGLDGGWDPNTQFPEFEYLPALGCVALWEKGDTDEFINALLDTGKVDINEQFTNEMCAVHCAAQVGNLKTLRTLVDRGADLGVLDSDGWTPLHTAIVFFKWREPDSPHRECLEFLLEQCTEEQLNVLDKRGQSAIHYAAQKRNLIAAEMVLNNKRGMSLQLDDQLVCARESAREALLDAFPQLKNSLPSPAHTDKMDASRLFQLLYLKDEHRFCVEFQKDRVPIATLLNANNGNWTFLQLACLNNLHLVVKLLLDFGVHPDATFQNTEAPVSICGRNAFVKPLTHLLPKVTQPWIISVLLTVCKYSENWPDRLKIIRKLIEDHDVDINCEDSYGNTALNYAQVNSPQVSNMLQGIRFINQVLNLGNEDVNERSSDGMYAVHYAASYGFPKALTALVERGANLASLDWDGRTALHTVVLADWQDDDNSHKECMTIILEKATLELINTLDKKGYSAIHWAAKMNILHAVELLLYNDRGIHLEDRFVVSNGGVETARDALVEAFPQLQKSINLFTTKYTNDASRLFQFIYVKDEDSFRKYFRRKNTEMVKLLSATNGTLTLMEEACINKLTKVVKYLLDCFIELDMLQSVQQLAIQYAEEGFYEPVNHLLPKCDKTTKNLLLLRVCKSSKGDYLKILKELVDDDEVDVNAHDHKGNTALYYAQVNSGDGGKAAKIIEGAVLKSVLKKINEKDELQHVPWELLRSFLDSKLTIVGGSSEENFVIKFDLQLNDPAEEGKIQSSKKWEPWRFPLPLLSMSKHPEQKRLLDHPLITAYTFIRWQHISILFHINLIFYLTFCLLLSGHVLYGYHMQSYRPQDGMGDVFNINLTLRAMLLVLVAIMIVRELIQLLMQPRDYLGNLENWLELPLIVLTITVVFMDCSSELGHELCPHFCAMVVLLAWLEFMLLIGKLPNYCVEVEMFYNVSYSYFRTLRTYIFPIFAFCLSFFVLFSSYPCDRIEKSGLEINQTDCRNSDPFRNIGTSFFKTILMLTGEFNSDGLGIHDRYIVTSHIIFIAFVFFIAVVLLNLLTGLAVADTRTMRNDAYLVTCIARIRLITFLDELLRNNIFSVLCRCFKRISPAPMPWIEVNSRDRSVELESNETVDCLMDKETVVRARRILKRDIRAGKSVHLNTKSIELIRKTVNEELQDCKANSKALNTESIEVMRELLKEERGPMYHINEETLRGIQVILNHEFQNEPVDREIVIAHVKQGLSLIDYILTQNSVHVKVNNL